ncbi:MAG: hypothetical protein U0521_08815 [Anaerolineae bacterium]
MRSLVTDAPDQTVPAYTAGHSAVLPTLFARLRGLATWYRDLCADGDDAWRSFPDPHDDFARCQRQVFCNMLLVLAGKAAFL